jgi:hypothetical protein
MRASVRALLDGIIDYAGLFPPAKLPLDEALRRYQHVCTASPHRWMLRSFICPTGRLTELATLLKAGQPITISALGLQAAEPSGVLAQVNADLRLIAEYSRARPADIVCNYEVAAPKGIASSAWDMAIDGVAALLQDANLPGFLEIPMGTSWRDDIDRVCQVIQNRGRKSQLDANVGLKLRCGGLSADAFPSDAQVAFFIDRCRCSDPAWKATAGLHHPRRHFDPVLNVWHHGFLNLFAASVFANCHGGFGEAELVQILADRDTDSFRFTETALAWRQWECTTKAIRESRRHFAVSFGSCSFEEPSDDLLAMGLLDATG